MYSQTTYRTRAIQKPKVNKYFSYLYIFGLFGCYASIKVEGLPSLSVFIFPVLYAYSLYIFYKVLLKNDVDYFLKFLFFLFGGITLSSLLCYEPLGSLQSIVYLIFNSIFGYIIYRCYRINQFLAILLNVMTFALILGFLLLFVNPDLVIYHDPLERASVIGLPNFKGLFPHKIHAGIYNSIGYVIALYFYRKTEKKKYLILSGMFLLAVLGSGSSLAFTAFLSIFLLTPAIGKIRSAIGMKGLMVSIAALLSIVIIGYYLNVGAYLLELMGRDPSLTGRTSIWEFGISYFLEHPLFGGGFDVFFDDNTRSPANALWVLMEYYAAPSFHNGYLQILAESGLIGAAPFLILLFTNMYLVMKARNEVFIAITLLCIFANFGAAILIKPNAFFFVFLIYTTLLTRKPTLQTTKAK